MSWSFQPNLYRVEAGACLPTGKALAERSFVPHQYSALTPAKTQMRYSQGFTLLELLVVIALLGLVSLAAVLSFDGVQEDAAVQITKTEMIEIRKALRQFKLDVGRFPDTIHPADFSQLTSRTLPASLVDYSPDTARGWRGPYLTSDGNGLVAVGTDLLADGTGSILTGGPLLDLAGAADEFLHTPAASNLLAWRQCTSCEYQAKFGRPFLLFDLDNVDARLVSMGPDGNYDGVNATDTCVPNNDDLVVCLR